MKKLKNVISLIVLIAMAAMFLMWSTEVMSPAESVNTERAGDETGIITGCIGDETGRHYNCGDIITENCTFNGDMRCRSGHGLIIGKDGITIDGNGYRITGPGKGSDKEGIRNEGYNNVTIKNLNIRGFCFGIYFKDANNNRIINNSIRYGMGSGIWLLNSSYNSLINNKIKHGDEGHGILISTSANNNTIEYNNITTINGRGICIENSNDTKLYYNYICCNAHGDIIVESSNGIVGSYNTCDTITDNGYNNITIMALCSCSCPPCSEVSGNETSIQGGDIITENYTFHEDIICPTGHGLIIGADGITIDGNGYTLDGVSLGSCDSFGIQRSGIYNPGYDDVVIKNLEIKNFCNGICIGYDEDEGGIAYRNVIENCEVHHNGDANGGDTSTHGIKMTYASNCVLSNNMIHDNTGNGDSCESGGNGIFLYGGGYNIITNNDVYNNKKGGIFTKMKSSYNTVTDNRVTGNGQGGIILRCKLSRFFMIEGNVVTNNTGSGIYVGGGGNTLMYNTVTDNTGGSAYHDDASVPNGIRISREAHDTSLISNTVTGNYDVDIYVKEGLTGTADYNNIYNTALNFEEVQGLKMTLGGSGGPYGSGNGTGSGTGFSSPPPTPLTATLFVFIALAVMLSGYLRNSTSKGFSQQISRIRSKAGSLSQRIKNPFHRFNS